MSDESATGIDPRLTRFLMTASAVFMALLGLAAALFTETILGYFGLPVEGFAVVLMKIVAGLYFGLAVLNWMARGNLIGGIYSRPVALANFAHFLAVTVVFAQQLPGASAMAEYGVTAGLNAAFAGAFGYVVFGGGGSCGGGSCG